MEGTINLLISVALLEFLFSNLSRSYLSLSSKVLPSGEIGPWYILTQEIKQVAHSEIEAFQHQLEHLAVIIYMVIV